MKPERLWRDSGETLALPESKTERHWRAPLIGARACLSHARLRPWRDSGGQVCHPAPPRFSRRRAVILACLFAAMKWLHAALRACARTVDHLEGRA